METDEMLPGGEERRGANESRPRIAVAVVDDCGASARASARDDDVVDDGDGRAPSEGGTEADDTRQAAHLIPTPSSSPPSPPPPPPPPPGACACGGRVTPRRERCVPMMRRALPVAMLCLCVTTALALFRAGTATGGTFRFRSVGESTNSNSSSSAAVEGTSPFNEVVGKFGSNLTSSPRPCPAVGRCGSLRPDARFSFVHISKCAGSSWIRELRNLFSPRIYPLAESGSEHSVAWQRSNHPAADNTLTSLRSPRHHVYSLFAECKYDGWGVSATRGTDFPRDGGVDEVGDLIDFDAWLDHFVVPNDVAGLNDTDATVEGDHGHGGHRMQQQNRRPPLYRPNVESTDRYNCYHPANYQARALTSDVNVPHGVERLPPDDGPARYEPDFAAANATYWRSLDWVALAEFYHESKCLLFHRLTRGGPADAAGGGSGGVVSSPAGSPGRGRGSSSAAAAVETMTSYLDDACVCPRDGGDSSSSAMDDVTVDHHEGGHRSSMRAATGEHGGDGGGSDGGVPPDTLAKVDALTRVDVRVYGVALAELVGEIGWMEGELGRRVMCDGTLRRWEPELEYLGLNVTELYYQSRTKAL